MNNPVNSEQLQSAASLSLKLEEYKVKNLYLLLQNGFYLEVEVGCTIEELFLNQLNLSPDFIKTRIQGIFLNGKPADHSDTAIVRDGARLTLSGTMPGLAGMSLRSGPLAVFRHGITHRETGDYNYSGKGSIQLKLLNLLMKYMGPGLLQKGIYLQATSLADYLNNLPESFWDGCREALLNDEQIAIELLQKGNWASENGMVKFSVDPC